MFVKLLRGFTAVAVVILAAAWGWEQFGLGHANKLVDDVNLIVDEANGFFSQASPKIKELNDEATVAAFPGNRAKVEPTVREVSELYTKAAEKYRAAAAKLDEASKQPVEAKVAEYFALRSQKFAKLAELADSLREFAGLYSDPNLKTLDDLKTKRTEIDTEVGVISAADDDLGAKSEKIQAEYPDLFK